MLTSISYFLYTRTRTTRTPQTNIDVSMRFPARLLESKADYNTFQLKNRKVHYDADPFLGLQLYTICPHLHSCTHIKGSSEYFECKSLIFIINCKFNSIPLYIQNPVVMCDTSPWLFFVVFHLLYVQFALAYLRFQSCTINNNTFCINCSVVPAVVFGCYHCQCCVCCD